MNCGRKRARPARRACSASLGRVVFEDEDGARLGALNVSLFLVSGLDDDDDDDVDEIDLVTSYPYPCLAILSRFVPGVGGKANHPVLRSIMTGVRPPCISAASAGVSWMNATGWPVEMDRPLMSTR